MPLIPLLARLSGAAVLARLCFTLSGALVCFVPGAFAQTALTLDLDNLNPLQANRGLAPLSDHWAGVDQQQIALSWQLANYYASSRTTEEMSWVDGETHRLDLVWQYGLAEHWQLGIKLPLFKHGAGFLDRFIFNFHETTSLPQAGRKSAQNDRYLVAYENPQGELFYRDRPHTGIGDLRADLTRRDATASGWRYLGLSLELPTGDGDKLTGNEAVDVSLGSLFTANTRLAGQNLDYWLGGGLSLHLDAKSHIGASPVPVSFSGRAGLSLPLPHHWDLRAQTDIASPTYNSGAKITGFTQWQLHLAGVYHVSKQQRWSLGLSEDLLSKSSPDITFHLRIEIDTGLTGDR